ncbi:MAG: NifU family protein [Polyangiaceae bacterium]
MPLFNDVVRLCTDQALPLIEADGGELYVASATEEEVHLHLAGTCSGCPGSTYTEKYLLAPIVKAAAAKAKLKLTTGYLVPKDAKRIGSGSAGTSASPGPRK